jgi:hypothetical protein
MVLVRDLTEVTPQFLGGLLAAPVATEVSS